MSDEDITRKLRATFVEELDQAVRILSRDLITLQNSASSVVRGQLVESLLRTMHSLKGAARSARLDDIETSCHLAESVLGVLRDQAWEASTSPPLVSLLLATVDGLATTSERLRDDGDADRLALATVNAELESALRRLADEPSTRAPVPQPDRPTQPSDRGSTEATATVEPRITAGRAFEAVCSELGKLAEELADDSGKRVDVVLEGAPWKVADPLGQQLREPLGHLVRNAVDHGIELPIERRAAGKPVRGRITIGAVAKPDAVHISVRDDGGGLDLDSLAAVARGRGVDVPADNASRAELAFVSGLSTSPEVTASSGRGVGLDAVRAWAEQRGGEIQVRSQPGSGATFTLNLPLERPTVRARLLLSSEGIFAIEEVHVTGLRRIAASEVRWLLGRPAVIEEGRPVAVAGLDALLGSGSTISSAELFDRELLHLQIGKRTLLLSCERVSPPKDLDMRPLGPRLRSSLVRAVAQLEGGEVAWLLHPESLANAALAEGSATQPHLSDEGGSLP